MSLSLTCSGCNNPNLVFGDFYWSKKDPKVKTQKQCKDCTWKKRHPEETEFFNIDLEWKKHYEKN